MIILADHQVLSIAQHCLDLLESTKQSKLTYPKWVLAASSGQNGAVLGLFACAQIFGAVRDSLNKPNKQTQNHCRLCR